MRSGTGTNFGLPWSVVSLTKVAIACLAGPSFHEGSGSSDPAARAREEMERSDDDKAGSTAKLESTARRLIVQRSASNLMNASLVSRSGS
jgi:hypothetical protein